MGEVGVAGGGVAPPTIGRVVHVIGPELRCPAIVTRVLDASIYGPLVIDAAVFPGEGATNPGYLDSSTGVVVGATLPHKTTPLRGAGPYYWIWPTEAP